MNILRIPLLVVLGLVCGLGSVSSQENARSRHLSSKAAAWWTFDATLRDEVKGLSLRIEPEHLINREIEDQYSVNMYVLNVPILKIDGRDNWRSFYRWGPPNLARGEMADELDPPRAFTIECYLKPREMFDNLSKKFQQRSLVLRKNRLKGGKVEPQWAIEIHKDEKNTHTRHQKRADLVSPVTFEMPDGTTKTQKLAGRNAIRQRQWQHLALIFDGKRVSLLIDHQEAVAMPGPGKGAKLLASQGKGELLLSHTFIPKGGRHELPPGERHLNLNYAGKIDELRISFAALETSELLPLPRVYKGEEALPEPKKCEEYASIARKHLGLLIEHGVDVYGPVHSPLIASTLDPDTLKMLEMKPPVGEGMPGTGDTYRSPIGGCNLTWMRQTLRAMRALSAVTGEKRFKTHADKAIKFWLDNCPYPSGAWPIGEHGLWNFHTDAPVKAAFRPHEPGTHMDWEHYWQINPEAVKKELILQHRIHIFEHRGLMVHGRHGSSLGHAKSGGQGFARFPGLFARSWAFLYSKTKDLKHLEWAKDQLDVMWKTRDPKTNLTSHVTYPLADEPGGHKPSAGTLQMRSVLGFLEAVRWLDSPDEKRLFSERATVLGNAIIDSSFGWNPDRKAFSRTRYNWVSRTDSPSMPWFVLKLWERAGRPARLLNLLKGIADERIEKWRPTTGTDSGCYGYMIISFVQLHNETKDGRYLEFARRLGDFAAENLVHKSGLVVGSSSFRYYDCMYNIQRLVQAFIAIDYPEHPEVEKLMRDPLF